MSRSFINHEPVDVAACVALVGSLGGDTDGLAVTLDQINVYAAKVKLSARALVAVMIHETNVMRATRYRDWRNPGGIAIQHGTSVEVWRPAIPTPQQVAAMLVAAFAQKIYKRSVHNEIPEAYTVPGMRTWLERSLWYTTGPNYPKSVFLFGDMTKPFRDQNGELQFVWAEDQDWDLGVESWYQRVPAKKEGSMSNDVPVLWQITPWERPNRPGGKLDLTRGGLRITMHDTDNKNWGTDALRHSTWQDDPGPNGGVVADVSAHFYVDDKRIVQKLPLDEIGYHAGDGCNDRASDVGCFRSVSIEMCVNSDANHLLVAKNAAQLVARIALGDPSLNWGDGKTKGKFSIERIDQHRWVTQSNDPHDCPHSLRHADYGTDWNEWLAMVDVEWKARATKPVRRRDYSAPVPPAFLKRDPLPKSVKWKGVVFTYTNRFWVAIKETPVLVSASRKPDVKHTRRPLTPNERARMLYEFESGGEKWGLTKAGSRIPLRDMKLQED